MHYFNRSIDPNTKSVSYNNGSYWIYLIDRLIHSFIYFDINILIFIVIIWSLEAAETAVVLYLFLIISKKRDIS